MLKGLNSADEMMPNNQDIMTSSRPDFPEELKKRAREFFSKGAEVAYTLNYDYAIELYLDGLNFWPDTVEEGHKPLREIALRRQLAGGKKVGFSDSSKYRKGLGKAGKDQMLKAEYLLCKDPGNIGHMTDVVKAAAAGEYKNTALWMANTLFEVNRQNEKPSFQTYVFLRDIYVQIEEFSLALQACNQALQLKPNDAALDASRRDLSAQATMQRGRYDGESDFRDSVVNKDQQNKIIDSEREVQSVDSRQNAITEARQEYQADPRVPGKINKLVNALLTTEKSENEDEAITILEKAYQETQQFQHLQRAGEIKIQKANRVLRQWQEKAQAQPADTTLKSQVMRAAQQALALELDHYSLCEKNYPTEMRIKYEYGKRLMRAKKFDEAIPMFQEARSDPRYRVTSWKGIGQCFFYKEWYADAIEMFEQALGSLEDAEGAMAKELRYNLGRALEADNKINEALDCYRKVAQLEYNYLDVKNRIDALRKRQANE